MQQEAISRVSPRDSLLSSLVTNLKSFFVVHFSIIDCNLLLKVISDHIFPTAVHDTGVG